MSSRIKSAKSKDEVLRELCDTDEDFDMNRLIREKKLAKKFHKAIS